MWPLGLGGEENREGGWLSRLTMQQILLSRIILLNWPLGHIAMSVFQEKLWQKFLLVLSHSLTSVIYEDT